MTDPWADYPDAPVAIAPGPQQQTDPWADYPDAPVALPPAQPVQQPVQQSQPVAHPAKDYDMEGALAAGIKPDERGHFPDTYKLPNHITFSTDSKYSNEKTPGGKWEQGSDKKWSYTPSDYVLQKHPAEELKAYFQKHEPDSRLILPDTAQPAMPPNRPSAMIGENGESMPVSQSAKTAPSILSPEEDTLLWRSASLGKPAPKEWNETRKQKYTEYQKAHEYAKRALFTDSDSGASVATEVPPEMRHLVLQAIEEHARERKAAGAKFYPVKLAQAATESVRSTTENVTHLAERAINAVTGIESGYTPEQWNFLQTMRATAAKEDPSNTYSGWNPQSWALKAAEFTGDVAGAGGVSTLAERGAVKLGLKKTAKMAGGATGAATVFVAPHVGEKYDALVEAGVDPSTARWAVGTGAVLDTALFAGIGEALGWKQGVPPDVSLTIAKRLAAWGKGAAHGTGIMAASAGKDAAIKDIALAIGGKSPGVVKTVEDTLSAAWNVTKETAGPMALLSVPRALASLPDRPSRTAFEKAGGPKGSSIEEREAAVKVARENVQQQAQPAPTQPTVQEQSNAQQVEQTATPNVSGGPRVEETGGRAVKVGGEGVREGGPEGRPVEEGKAEVGPTVEEFDAEVRNRYAELGGDWKGPNQLAHPDKFDQATRDIEEIYGVTRDYRGLTIQQGQPTLAERPPEQAEVAPTVEPTPSVAPVASDLVPPPPPRPPLDVAATDAKLHQWQRTRPPSAEESAWMVQRMTPGTRFTVKGGGQAGTFEVQQDGTTRNTQGASIRHGMSIEDAAKNYRPDQIEFLPAETPKTTAETPAPEPVKPQAVERTPEVDSFEIRLREVPALSKANVTVHDGSSATIDDGKGWQLNVKTHPKKWFSESVSVSPERAKASLDAIGAQSGTVAALYEPKTKTLHLGEDFTPDQAGHEVVHAMRDLGLISADEIKIFGTEEDAAYAYGEWIGSGKKTQSGLFQRIWDFVSGLVGNPAVKQRSIFRDLENRLAKPEAKPESTPISDEILKIARTVEGQFRKSGMNDAADEVNGILPALANAGVFDPSKGHGGGWYHQAIRNAALTAFRDAQKGAVPKGKRELGSDVEQASERKVEEPSEEDQAVESAKDIRKQAMAQLPEDLQAALNARYPDGPGATGQSYAKVAKSLGMKPTTARERVIEAEKQLGRIMDDMLRQPEPGTAAAGETTKRADENQGAFWFRNTSEDSPGSQQGTTFTLSNSPGLTFTVDGDRVIGFRDGEPIGQQNREDFGDKFFNNVDPANHPVVNFDYSGVKKAETPTTEPKRKVTGLRQPPTPPAAKQGKPSPLGGKVQEAKKAASEPPSEPTPTVEPAAKPEPPIRGGPSAPIPVSLTPTGETISTGKVVKQLSEQFGVPIRKGHFRGPHAAIYKTLEEVARLKGYGDIAAASHEVAHHLDKVGGVLRNWQAVPAAARAELSALDYQPNRGDIHEGFAEYMRHRLTMDDAATVAPQFDAWFNNTWLIGKDGAANAIDRAKETVTQWRNAGSLARVEAQIDMGESRLTKVLQGIRQPVKTIRTVADWITDNWINRLAPLLRVSKEMVGAKTSGEVMKKMGADFNFWAFAKISNMAASAKARAWAEYGIADVAGNKVGSGLRETLAPIAKELRDQSTLRSFYAYCYARHAVDLYELHAQAMNDWIAGGQRDAEPRLKQPGILEADARSVVAQFDTRPGWQAASDGITNWHNSLVDYLVDAGGLSKESADIMQSMYPHYISLARKMDSQFAQGPGGGGSRYENLPSAVKRLKGSGREILPPLESALSYAERIIGIADKVRVGRMLVEAAEKYDMLGDMVEKVDPKTVPHSARIESLESQLKKAGADLSTADMDAMLTVFSQEVTGDPKDNIITLYRDGERQAYWVRDDLYRSLTAYGKLFRLPPIIDAVVGKVARTIRLGATGVRAGFSLVTNPLRDVQTAMMQTEYQSRNPFSVVANTVGGFVSEITKNDVAQLWERGGGPMAQPLSIDRAFLKEAVQELTAQNPKEKALNWMRHPVDSLRSLFSLPESAPRLAEFEAAIKAEGWKPGQKLTFEQYIKGQLSAANVSVDFREGGSLAMWFNQITPFFNANIQGPARMAAALRNHPAATITSGLLWLTLPSLALWWKQKYEEWYKQLTPMEKYRYWHVKIPGTDAVLRVPRPFEWGHLFASMPEGAMETAYGENPKAFSESVGLSLNNLVPNPIPGIAGAPIEIAANWDFFRGAPLVPERMKRLKPEDQQHPYTSETAKKIGSLFGVSPIYVEHLAEGWTGGLATDAVKAIESGVGAATHKTHRQIVGGKSTIPVVGRLFLSPLHTRALDDFYKKLEKEEREYGSAKEHGKAKLPPVSLHNLRAASDAMSKLRTQSRSILDDSSMTDDEKRTAFMKIHVKMIDVATRASAGKFVTFGKTKLRKTKNIF